MDVNGKIAIVTGGAAGIGAAIARRLVDHGARVVVADLSADGVEKVVAELNASHDGAAHEGASHGRAARDGGASRDGAVHRGSAIGASCDVSETSALKTLIAGAQEEYGPVDMFFANAGVGLGAGLEADDAAWETSLNVNVLAHVRAARLLVPGWVERGEGYFFSTASAAGLLTQIGSPTYTVSKHAAVGFAEWLRVTYGDRGVRVSCLCPMGVNTALLNGGDDSTDASAQIGAAAVKGAGAVLEPLDVADTVIEAIGDERFLVLPHPEVLAMYRHKGDDYERWISGMQRYRTSLEA